MQTSNTQKTFFGLKWINFVLFFVVFFGFVLLSINNILLIDRIFKKTKSFYITNQKNITEELVSSNNICDVTDTKSNSYLQINKELKAIRELLIENNYKGD